MTLQHETESASQQKTESIKSKIQEFKNSQKELAKATSDPNMEFDAKNQLISIFSSESDNLANEIVQNYNSNDYAELNATMLNDCAIFLKMRNKIPAAINISLMALQKCFDKNDSSVCLRTLASLYCLPGSQQNINKSRAIRREEIELSKLMSNIYLNANITQSFILWSSDEYYVLNNTGFAKSLLDSAEKYASKITRNEPGKANYLFQIQRAKIELSGIKSLNNSIWDLYRDNQKIGNAYFFLNDNKYTLEINFIHNSLLVKQIKAIGQFINPNELYFNGNIVYVEKINNVRPTKDLRQEFFYQTVINQNTIFIDLRLTLNKEILLNCFELNKPKSILTLKPKF